jgi:hypothetical protein
MIHKSIREYVEDSEIRFRAEKVAALKLGYLLVEEAQENAKKNYQNVKKRMELKEKELYKTTLEKLQELKKEVQKIEDEQLKELIRTYKDRKEETIDFCLKLVLP